MADERRQADSAPADDPAPADKRPPATARPRPVAHYLTFLVLVCLLPAFTFSAYLLIRTNSVQQEGLQTLFQANTRSLVQLLDQEVASMLTTLRVLSSDSAFRTGDLETFHRRARNALIGREMFLVILDDDLTPQLSTAIEFGTPLPPVSDRTTPRRALENRAPVVSDVVFTQAILDWIFFTALPIYAEGRDPVLMLTVRRTDSLDDVLDANRLPGAWQVAIVDSSRNLVSTTDPSLRPGGALPFVFPEDLVNGVGEVEIGGSSFRVIEEHSALTQWSVIAWAPNATITAPVWRSIVLLVAGGIAFGLIAAGSAWFVGRRIARSARRLSANAERLGAGDPVQNDPHSIEEFAVISSAMIHAAQNREEAESEIRLLMREGRAPLEEPADRDQCDGWPDREERCQRRRIRRWLPPADQRACPFDRPAPGEHGARRGLPLARRKPARTFRAQRSAARPAGGADDPGRRATRPDDRHGNPRTRHQCRKIRRAVGRRQPPGDHLVEAGRQYVAHLAGACPRTGAESRAQGLRFGRLGAHDGRIACGRHRPDDAWRRNRMAFQYSAEPAEDRARRLTADALTGAVAPLFAFHSRPFAL
jgi:hypothetical protein